MRSFAPNTLPVLRNAVDAPVNPAALEETKVRRFIFIIKSRFKILSY